MRIKKKIIFSLFSLILFLAIGIGKVSLAEKTDSPILIQSILPENQRDKSLGYFDLKVKPLDTQKVKIRVTNETKEPIKLKIGYSNAKTTSEGVIEYSKNKELKVDTPKGYSFEEIVSGPSEIHIKSQEVREVEFLISMPEESFDGFIAGGVEFIQEVDTHKESSLIVQRSYLVGFKLSETEEALPISIGIGKSHIGLKNYKTAIVIPLLNLNSNYIEDVSVTTSVIKKKDRTVILQEEKKNMRIAPFSTLELPIYLDDTLLEVGSYDVLVKLESQKDFKKEWSQTFDVTHKDRELITENNKAWENDTSKKIPKLVLLLIVTLMLVILVTTAISIRTVHKRKKVEINGKKKSKK